ncbi:MAG: EAL domain-containing protein [Pseudomonadota bacterium]
MDGKVVQSDECAASPPPALPAAPGIGGPWLQASFDQAPVGIVHLDMHGFFLRANTRMCALLDFSAAELAGKHFTRRMVSDDSPPLQAEIAQFLTDPGRTGKHEVRLLRRGGELNPVQITTFCVVDNQGQPVHLGWWVTDLTQRKQLKDMLQLSNRVLAACSNGVLITDASQPSYPIMYANPAFCAMTGYDLIDVMGRNCRFLQNDDRDQPAVRALRAAVDGRQNVHVMLRNYRKDGSLFWNDLFVSAVPDEHGRISHYIGILNDVTAFKQNEDKLAFQAGHDELTLLPNRHLFGDRLRQAILQSTRQGDMVALLCLGIDNFHTINENLGHAAGDRLLKDIAARLLGCVRGNDTVSRHGGNEFVLILGQIRHPADVTALCEAMLHRLAEPFLCDGQPLHASYSVGIALAPQDGEDGATLLDYADMALARAREQGQGKYQFFSTEMNQRTLERLGMETALRLAIANDQLQVMYQPMVDLQSGLIDAFEALVRWQHPTLGLLSAGHFIAVAEEAGLTATIGDWVLERACHDLRDWRRAGHASARLAINISPKQFRERGLGAKVATLLKQSELGPGALCLEITEAALQQDAGAGAQTLAQLQALGVGLALDDFGTGYSALSNLKRFPFDQVKIDGSFIREVVTDLGDAALAKTIISMAHHLGLRVVAEGVETEAQCDFLRRNMCDLIQGYFFAPPMHADEAGALMQAKRSLPEHLLRLPKQQRTLLLVDDEQNIVSAVKRLLRREDYHILTANSGQEGLDLLTRHKVDVIVSDQRMPGMIGADFLRKAKQLYPDTIRIMLSGYTELQSVTDAVNEGAIYKFLTKPWEDELLRGHIADAFRLKEISDDNTRLNLELRTANHDLASANRKMEALLLQQEKRISSDEISLNIARELLQFMPLPVIGMDDDGMIAFINAAAESLFRRSGALLGNEANIVLPELFPASAIAGPAMGPLGGAPAPGHLADIEGNRYAVRVYPMGANSASRGSLITLSRHEDTA